MARCASCGKESELISRALQICLDCIRTDFRKVISRIQRIHARSRMEFDLPIEPPRGPSGAPCSLCANECMIPEGGRGYCGLRRNAAGTVRGGTESEGNLSWYYDHLPTNCVADWVCAGGSKAGYPEFSHSSGPEYGYKNLAVFYQSCCFNCLFCQNWHFRKDVYSRRRVTAQQLADCVDEKTSCICYFGGDPAPQVEHALEASRAALRKSDNGILRICWETNGAVNPQVLEKMADLSLKSGGCIKFDLKAFDENLNMALCGASNRRTLSNLGMLSEIAKSRRDPPFLVASTLLVPGYVDKQEVSNIASLLAGLDRKTPYALLGFHPQFYMTDLPPTSKRHAEECRQAAIGAGLRNVRIGNVHLLGNAY